MPYRPGTKQPFALRPSDVHSGHISGMASMVAHKLQDSDVRGTGKTLYIRFNSIGADRLQTAALEPKNLKYYGDIGFKLESRGGGIQPLANRQKYCSNEEAHGRARGGLEAKRTTCLGIGAELSGHLPETWHRPDSQPVPLLGGQKGGNGVMHKHTNATLPREESGTGQGSPDLHSHERRWNASVVLRSAAFDSGISVDPEGCARRDSYSRR